MPRRFRRLPWVGLLALAWVALGFALVQANLKPHPIAPTAQCPVESSSGTNS
ncbi:MAG: hypothetical protein SNJ84_07075 [Verrucomicrobiia bacterium]